MSSDDDIHYDSYEDSGGSDDNDGYDDSDEYEEDDDEGELVASTDNDSHGSDGSDDDANEDSDNGILRNVSDDSEDDDSDDRSIDYDQNEEVYLEFDGASKGNPGRAGGGAVLKSRDGTVITRVHEGLGYDTNNGAEYKALIRGLKTARKMGYDHIHVKGDSELVCKQVQGQWQTRNDNMSRLCEKVKELKDQFKEFKISHVPRGHNSDADAEANKGVNLPPGQVQREDNPNYRPHH